jgi:crotonobetainyl-CoA:carnitine CoA-transferase CaiB-like acyl-CoA transferase
MAKSGFGPQGPLSRVPDYDPIIQAHASMVAGQGLGRSVFIRNLVCGKITSYTAGQAVISVLYLWVKTGEGQHIDLSMLDSGLFFLFPYTFMNYSLLDDDIDSQSLLSDLIYELTLTSDGGLTFSAGVEKQRSAMLRAVGLEALIEYPRFKTAEAITDDRDVYIALVRDAF